MSANGVVRPQNEARERWHCSKTVKFLQLSIRTTGVLREAFIITMVITMSEYAISDDRNGDGNHDKSPLRYDILTQTNEIFVLVLVCFVDATLVRV